ncbi:MAG: carbohydrate binding family 9 domain-containing protein [Gemmatimonadota bacterium]|nr:carbohydrate binding family 9 domain-containing protein [Gemmatimonadota bacterium]
MARAALRQGEITIDGRLDDPAWAGATPITELTQSSPDEGKPASQKTELRILYDASAIYIGARMYDSLGAAGVRSALARRDQVMNGDNNLTSDKIAVVFDTFRDKNSRSWFELNPDGVKGDHQNGDASYDPVWEGATKIDSLGWTAEFRIPYSQLRFSRDTSQVWGMQIWRTIDRRNEQDMWAFWRNNEYGGPAYFGTLEGITVNSRPRQVELVPYATSRNKLEHAKPDDPYHSRSEMTYRVGGDAKINLTSNLTLDATINPDFGQVEVDPAVVNLSVFETTFSEKRPFFVSNSQYFSTGGFSCYFCSNVSSLNFIYTRRIGRSPQLAGLLSGKSDFMDAAEATTILGAAKVTGRTSSGISVGLLDAVTNREKARFRPTGSNVDDTQEIEPLTNYFIGRLRKDFRGGATRVGTITTMVNRALTNPDEVARLRSNAQAAGLDLDHHWANREYSLNIQTALSHIGGDTAAIRRAQNSSARYFQRPGRYETTDGLFSTTFDPTRRNLYGYGFYARLAKETGDWLWETTQNWRSPGFEANDLGVLGRADYKWMMANVFRQWTTPGRWYRQMYTILGAQQQVNYEGRRTDVDYHAWGQVILKNYMNLNGFTIRHPSTYDERLTRGGPTVIHYGYNMYSLFFGTDSRPRVVGNVQVQYITPVDNTEGGRVAYYPSLTIKPSSRFLINLGPSLDFDNTAQQFVTAVTDPNVAPEFAGTRYVFGRLRQKTFSLDTRVNTTFTPNLTLELFAQPFLASGKYTSFKEFAEVNSRRMNNFGRDNGSTVVTNTDPQTGAITGYTVDPDGPSGAAAPFTFENPDFNLRSLRGTSVLRWEYRPGSTLFFVWTQERDGSDKFGDFNFNRDRSALFRDRPKNVFQVKATYWIGR